MHDHESCARTFEEFHNRLKRGEQPDLFHGWLPCPGDCPECREALKDRAAETLYHAAAHGRKLTTADLARDRRVRSRLTRDDLLELQGEEFRARQQFISALYQGDGQANGAPARAAHPAGTPPRTPPAIAGYAAWEFVAEGTWAEVWKATQDGSGLVFAFKVAKKAVADENLHQQFKNQARAQRELRHANLCEVDDGGFTADQRPYLRMRFIEGVTLRWWAAHRSQATLRDVALGVADLAEGLGKVHDRGIIHRDITPDNILVEAGEPGGPPRFVLTDFGLAKLLGDKAASPRGVVGTPAYWAPEQHPDHDGGPTATPQSDLYALGLLLYELACGCHPFAEADEKVFWRKARGRYQRPRAVQPSVSRDLEAVITKALEADPEDRYGSAADFAEDLRAFARGEFPPHARPVSLLRRECRKAVSWCRRHPIRALAVTGIVTSLLVAVAWHLVVALPRSQIAEHEQAISAVLRAETPTDTEWDSLEPHLVALTGLDAVRGIDARVRVLYRLMALPWHTEKDLERVERGLDRLAAVDADRAATARQEFRRKEAQWLIATRISVEDKRKLYSQLCPFANTGSLYFLLKVDAKRVQAVKDAVRIQNLIDPGGRIAVGARHELLRIYLLTEKTTEALKLAEELLARPDLPPAWRLIVARDWAWLLAEDCQPDRLRKAVQLVDTWIAQARTAPRKDALSLLVVRAELHLALGEPDQARKDLADYFSEPIQRAIGMTTEEPAAFPNPEDDQPFENSAVVQFLDGCLLQGFLLEGQKRFEEARKVWSMGYNKVRGTPVGHYYEVAIMGSLCGELSQEDGRAMIVETLKRPKAKDTDRMLELLQEQPELMKFMCNVLQDSWITPTGRDTARRFAYRQIKFRDYPRAQAVRWLAAAMRMFVGGWTEANRKQPLRPEQERLVEAMAREMEKEFLAGRIDVETVVALMLVVPQPKGDLVWMVQRLKLDRRLQGRFAYLFGCHWERNFRNPERADWYFKQAAEAAKCDTELAGLLKLRHANLAEQARKIKVALR
jgi:tRNA A-37 threonylcarbamoyl transferase component Bud32